MADADQKHDEPQDEAPVLDLELPEDEASSVAGGTPNIVRTQQAAAAIVANKTRP